MKVASLFSGIGGFEKGILQADPNTEIVFASEIDPYARKIYTKNYGVEPHGDITKIEPTNIPDHDILCGGFPCQAFSIAGLRRGFEDTRGTLFFEIMRIVKIKRPHLLFLENVRGLLSHDAGRTFKTVLRTMDDMGYDAEWQVFNSKNHGVPQNRERVFIIGHLRGSGRRQIFPITANDRSPDDVQRQRTNTLTSRYEGAQATGSYIIESELDAQKIISHSTLPRSSKSGKGGTGHLQRNDGITYCIDAANNVAVEVKKRIRRLTPIECERLQGFPQYKNYISVNIHNNTICIDHQKSYVNVETKNHKLQKRVLSVENGKSQKNVKYVDENSVQSYQPIKKHVQKNVHINCAESVVEIHNQKKSSPFANFVESQNSYHQHIKTEDFVRMLVGINIMCEKIITFGKEESHQNEQFSIHRKNGKTFVKLYGKEMMQLVPSAEIDLITLRKHLKCIISNHLNSNYSDLNSIISFFYVMTVITGCIQTKTKIKDSLNLDIHSVFGYTYGISDTQRYKCLGNAVTVNVIEFIAKRLFKMMEQR